MMIDENINTLKKLNIAEYNIIDLENKIDNVKNGKEVDYNRGFYKEVDYNRGFYMGYIFALYDTGLIDSVDLYLFASEIEEP